MGEDEIILAGGNSNDEVVRVGDTVRRAIGPSSATVHSFLNFLSEKGFNKSPRFLGIDDKGCESLSYMHGDCSISPLHWQDDKYITCAAVLLREFHQISSNYISTDEDRWGVVHPDPSQHEVICHNDFAPYNLIFDENGFSAVIDFDLAGPGPRLRDVAYCAYWLVPVSQRANDTREYALADVQAGSTRLKKFCKLYGIAFDVSLLDMMSAVLNRMADESVMIESIGAKAAARLVAEGHIAHWQGEALAFDDYRNTLEANIS